MDKGEKMARISERMKKQTSITCSPELRKRLTEIKLKMDAQTIEEVIWYLMKGTKKNGESFPFKDKSIGLHDGVHRPRYK